MATIPASMPPSTANWHWKNKNVTPWAKTWFERELPLVLVQSDGNEVSVSEVVDVEGDVELGQRKSKLITIYDCRVELKWTGKASDGTEVAGKLSIPEVSHEITLDGLSEYVWNFSLTTESSPAVDAVYKLAKDRLPKALEAKFSEFPPALINTHGKDLTVSTDPSRSTTPAPSSTSAPTVPPTRSSAPAAPSVPKPTPAKAVNTATVTVEASFMASADDLFSLFTDEKRIPSWTRAPAQSAAKPDTEYSLFGGGVKGKYVTLNAPKEIVQTWALSSPSWPSGHFATLTTTINQQSDNTKVTWSLVGVPLGMEEEINHNINGYYVHGLKAIGYVQLQFLHPTPSSTSKISQARSTTPTEPSSRPVVAVGLAVLALFAAFAVPYLYK